MRDRLAALRAYLRGGGDAISRRYFISNGFDGTLTSVGIAVGSLLSGVPEGAIVVKIGLGAAVGLGTSGVWSVWEIERAEKLVELQRVERAMLTDLSESRVHRQKQRARRRHATMSGIGPILGVVVPLSAYLLEGSLLTMLESTVLAVALAVALLFLFGAYLGSISRQRWYWAGVRMGAAGIFVAIVNVVLPG